MPVYRQPKLYSREPTVAYVRPMIELVHDVGGGRAAHVCEFSRPSLLTYSLMVDPDNPSITMRYVTETLEDLSHLPCPG